MTFFRSGFYAGAIAKFILFNVVVGASLMAFSYLVGITPADMLQRILDSGVASRSFFGFSLFAAVGLVVTVALVRYLSDEQPGIDGRHSVLLTTAKLSEIEQQLRKFELSRDHLDTDARAELVADIAARIRGEATESYLNELRIEVKSNQYRVAIAEAGEKTLSRVYSEIRALARRGTINLVLGVMTALTGISALAYFVVADVSRTFASLSDFAIAFLPRLSIIVIIEMFSYFFLRLYKSSLSEIKYFQNEATNIEFNFVALESALHLQDAPLIHKALEHFIRVERNPILRTGQSTREIEDAKQLDSALKWTPAQFAEILKVLSPNRTAEPPQK